MEPQAFFHISKLSEQREKLGKRYLEFLRIPAMSAGVYVLPAGGDDAQSPHQQDELYYIVSGRARMRAGAEDREVASGDVIYVAAQLEHRFYDVTEELVVLVFFAPAETS
jgi:mannose-6-phosphate isomerase-like protein (cupin superfamily)